MNQDIRRSGKQAPGFVSFPESRKKRTVGKEGSGQWARAVFTVEAAVILPLALTVIALLLGFCYYTHQLNWCRGAAVEAALKGTESGAGTKDADNAAKQRMEERIREIPLDTGKVSAEVSSGVRIRVSWSAEVLPEVFGGRFAVSGDATVMKADPARLKRITYLLRGAFKGEEKGEGT